jgi:hypothetical protein
MVKGLANVWVPVEDSSGHSTSTGTSWASR